MSFTAFSTKFKKDLDLAAEHDAILNVNITDDLC